MREEHGVEPAGEGGGLAGFRERVGDITQKRAHVTIRKRGGPPPVIGDGSGPERFDPQPEALEIRGRLRDTRGIERIELDDLGNEQKLPGDSRLFALAFEPLIDESAHGRHADRR